MITMTDTITPTLDYKVADITLAEFGVRKLPLPNMKCPVSWRPVKNTVPQALGWSEDYGFLAHDHSDCRSHRNPRGSRRRRSLVLLQHLFYPRPCRAAIAAAGVPVFAWKGETLEDYGIAHGVTTWRTVRVPTKLLTMVETPHYLFTKALSSKMEAIG